MMRVVGDGQRRHLLPHHSLCPRPQSTTPRMPVDSVSPGQCGADRLPTASDSIPTGYAPVRVCFAAPQQYLDSIARRVVTLCRIEDGAVPDVVGAVTYRLHRHLSGRGRSCARHSESKLKGGRPPLQPAYHWWVGRDIMPTMSAPEGSPCGIICAMTMPGVSRSGDGRWDRRTGEQANNGHAGPSASRTKPGLHGISASPCLRCRRKRS